MAGSKNQNLEQHFFQEKFVTFGRDLRYIFPKKNVAIKIAVLYGSIIFYFFAEGREFLPEMKARNKCESCL